jgi:hypothetical protein
VNNDSGVPTVEVGAARRWTRAASTGQEVSAAVTVYDNNP